jgi:glycosyltransferase involved in cell wall biosynthesis
VNFASTEPITQMPTVFRAMNATTSVPAQEALRSRDIVCFSHDWTGDPLSKTHIMRVLSRDNRILWVNAIANRMPTASAKDASRLVKKIKSFAESVKEVERNIFVLNPLAVPAYESSAIVALNRAALLWQVKSAMRDLGFQDVVNMVFNPAAGMIAGRLGESRVIYYCVDEYTAFTGATNGLKAIEDDLFRNADIVVVSAEKLLRDKLPLNGNTHLIRHGTDWKHFRSALDPSTNIPDDIRYLPRPIIGFHGLLADWLDFDLIRKLGERFATGSVVLIGKTTVDAEHKIRVLEGAKNVYRLGRKPYSTLPAYCKAFDVAINPFVISELTLAANPLKVREYLAAGCPVVSTDIPEVRVLEHCRVAGDHEEFLKATAAAIDAPPNRERISNSVRHESWEAKVEELRHLMARQPQ